MNFPPRFLDELRDRVVLSEIVGQKVRLTKKGREFSGLCPFHREKTPSFTLNDDKGFYHCFGCGAHGDALSFLMEHDKMPFTEAVEYLAARVGLPLPKPSRQEAEKEKTRHKLSDIMEAACVFFQKQLFSPAGEAARTYLKGRGITGAIAKQFRLGYAPMGSALTAHLEKMGFDKNDCRALGLLALNESQNRWHDYFYDRVMFPILDRRRRVIGFGGRLMTKGEPKYLNSPETELFHKGEQLYALSQAIETIRKTNSAVLVEGYMDVIALHAAGFTNAVAPLGTALTEQQINLLWTCCDEPTICFDGDTAGRKAAVRALNRALPILSPGKSLQFVLLPDGYDPDDMIRKKSPDAFQKALEGAKPATFMLWNTLMEGRRLDTPERLAKFETDVKETVSKIKNKTVRNYYQKAFKNNLWQLGRQKTGKSLSFQKQSLPKPTPNAALARMLLAYAYRYPETLETISDELSDIHLPDPALAAALQQILSLCVTAPETDASKMEQALGQTVRPLIAAEIEMLDTSERTADDVKSELSALINRTQIDAIKEDISQKTRLWAASGDSVLWDEICLLKKEIEKRSC